MLCPNSRSSGTTYCKGSPYNRPGRPIGGVDIYLYPFFNLSSRWRWEINAMPWLLYPLERPSTQCIGCWVGPKASLDITNSITYKREYVNCLIETEVMLLSWCIRDMVFIRTVVKILKIST
jgi:hypothetical protein